MNRKRFSADMTVSEGDRSFVATITNDHLDRDSEVLLPEGMDPGDFHKTGTIFWNHDYSVPIGTATGLKQLKDGWQAKARIVARPENHPEAAEWFPDTLLHLMQQGVVRGVSVGFAPLESRRPSVKDKERFGDSLERVISKWKMNEFSVTPMPANQDALISAVSKGIITAEAAKTLFRTDLEPRPKPERKKISLVIQRPSPKPRRKATVPIRKKIAIAVARATGRLFLDD